MSYVHKSLEQTVADMYRAYEYSAGGTVSREPGSVLRALFEATGFKIEELSFDIDRRIQEAIPEQLYSAFGYPELEPQAAEGQIRFARAQPPSAPIEIPAGTVVQTRRGLRFKTLSDTQLSSPNQSVSVQARAELTGPEYNVQAGEISVLGTLLPGIEAVANVEAFTGGRASDDEAERARLFRLERQREARGSLPGLAAGATGVRAFDQIVRKAVASDYSTDPELNTFGQVTIFIYTGLDLSNAIVQAVETELRREQYLAGIVYEVKAVTFTPKNLSIVVHTKNPATLPLVEAAAYAYYDKLKIGEDVHEERLIWALTDAHPDIYRVTFNTDAAYVVGRYEVAQLGRAAVLLNERIED